MEYADLNVGCELSYVGFELLCRPLEEDRTSTQRRLKRKEGSPVKPFSGSAHLRRVAPPSECHDRAAFRDEKSRWSK